MTSNRTISLLGLHRALPSLLIVVAAALSACGGHHHRSEGDGLPAGDAPTIVTQPADLSVTAGQAAAFSVVAEGPAPLVYQWRRDGTAIAGATAASFTLDTTTVADGGAGFSVVVENGFGNVESRTATLSVNAAAAVLTVTAQPADQNVVPGASASFAVAATCSAGNLGVQWQRSQSGSAYAPIAGATATTYAFAAVAGDSGAQFRALLDCSGQSATASSAATLTVAASGTVTLSAQPVVGRIDQADIGGARAIVRDADGSFVFGTDSRVMRLSADLQSIATIAGSGEEHGIADGPATAARFSQISALALDGAGNVYVADSTNHTIRRIAANGTVTTIAGVGEVSGNADGTGSAARFNNPTGIAFGPDGDLYVADSVNHRIRRVTTSGVVTTYAGSTQGYADAAAAAAQFNNPYGVAVAANGDVLVSDFNNGRIRRIVRAGNGAGAVQTLAGNGTGSPWPDGAGTVAAIQGPSGMVLAGNALTLHDQAGLIRQVDIVSGVVTTIAGSRTATGTHPDGSLATARFDGAGNVAVAAGGGFLVADESGTLRTVSAAGDVRTIASSRAVGRTPTGTGVLAQMPLGLANPTFNPIATNTETIAVDPAGNLVIGELQAAIVRRVSPAGVVTPIAGLVGATGTGGRIIDGTGSEAQFQATGAGIAIDASGVIYVADAACLRRIGTDNAVTLLAGSRTESGAVDGTAAAARFKGILAVAVRGDGSVFVADPFNRAVRRIDPSGNVSTWAGVLGQNGTADGPIASARLSFPSALAFAPDGALLVADDGRLRRIEADGSAITTIIAPPGVAAVGGDIAVDSDGTVYWGGDASNFFTSGLWKLAPGASEATLLVRQNPNFTGVVLGSGSTAQLAAINGLALVGPKQLVVLSNGQIVRVSVP